MKSNDKLGYEEIVNVDGYTVGKKGNKYRAYGYEYHDGPGMNPQQSYMHHEVSGRGDSAEFAVESLIESAIRASEAGPDGDETKGHSNGLTNAEALRLRDELLEELAELED